MTTTKRDVETATGLSLGHNGSVYVLPLAFYDGPDPLTHLSWTDVHEVTAGRFTGDPTDGYRVLYSSRMMYESFLGDTDHMRESNGDRVREDFPNAPWFRISYADGWAWALDVTDAPRDHEEWSCDTCTGEGWSNCIGRVLDVLVRLDDEYPCYDEEDYSRREWEGLEEAFRRETDWIASRDFEDDGETVERVQARLFASLTEADVYRADDLYRHDLAAEYAKARIEVIAELSPTGAY